MAKFVYLDETGSVGKGAANQPELRLVAAIVDESQVMPLGQSMKQVARDHLGGRPPGFEFHGQELWHGQGCWEGKSYPELLAVYLDVMTLLEDHEVDVAYSAIDKKKLSAKYDGMADENAYLLALQFLLEKIDQNMGESLKIVVADEARQEQLKAMSMVADMQEWGSGVVPGRRLDRVVDSLHFVRSDASPGVQMADMVAFAMQRYQRGKDHPDALKALAQFNGLIAERVRTYRMVWPS